MAILVDNTTQAENGTTSSTTLSWSHTCSGDERALVVVVPCSRAVTCSVTYNSVSMTSLASVVNGTNRAYIFGLAAPSIGSNTITVTYSANLQFYVAGAVSFTGVSQSDILGATASQTGTAGAKSLSLTTEANGSYLVDCIGSVGTVHTVGAGQTKFATPALNRVSSYKSAPTAGTNGTSWTGFPSTAYAYALVEILASLTQSITATGITSDEEFGSHSVSLEVNSSGITSSEAFGSHEVSLKINPSGIASDETFGTNSVTLEVNNTGISSAESFGSYTVSLRVNPSGIVSAEAFGDHEVTAGLFIIPDGIASAEAFGNHEVYLEINPTGITSGEAFGDHEVTAGLSVEPDGIASGEAFGSHVVSLEINPSGITSSEAFGNPVIPIEVNCTGITSGESFGTSQINLKAVCTSISSEESFSAQSSLFTDLISLWKLDETSGTRVDSIGDNDLTDNSTVGSATGLINRGASFTGALESLSIDDNASINVSGNINWSYSVWVKLANKTFSYGILNKGTPSTGEWHLEYLSSSDRFRFGVRGSAKTTVSANELGSPVAGVWYHILVWHDADNDEIGIQVNNGTSDVSSHSSGVKIGTDTFHIGRNPGVFNPPLNGGLIDEVKFWKKILTTQEKSDLYNSGSGISLPEQGIVLTLGPEPQTLETTGITSAESFGTSQLNLKIASNSINSSEDFGTSQINLEVSPTSVSSSESFGIANIGSQTVSPSSILSSESFGTSQINLQIVPISISSSESFGTLSVNLELVTSSISSEESFGTTQLNQEITPSGIESSEVFGSHTVELSGTQNVQPSGISSDESFGSATISLKVNCTGITSSESFGIHSLSQHILHTSITSEESFGSHILSDDSNVGYLFKRKILQRKSNIKLNDNRFTSLKLLDDRIGNVKISNLTQIKSKILSRRNKTKLEE